MREMLKITFKSRFRSGRTWVAYFDMGSDDANWSEALRISWTHNATIASHSVVTEVEP